ncbi:hypothetical protein GCM10018966_069080 [Streptomyces yanii]
MNPGACQMRHPYSLDEHSREANESFNSMCDPGTRIALKNAGGVSSAKAVSQMKWGRFVMIHCDLATWVIRWDEACAEVKLVIT